MYNRRFLRGLEFPRRLNHLEYNILIVHHTIPPQRQKARRPQNGRRKSNEYSILIRSAFDARARPGRGAEKSDGPRAAALLRMRNKNSEIVSFRRAGESGPKKRSGARRVRKPLRKETRAGALIRARPRAARNDQDGGCGGNRFGGNSARARVRCPPAARGEPPSETARAVREP
jgi:hypothetical protein